MYTLQVIYNGQVQKTTTYQTLPGDTLERNLVIATGGDVGANEHSKTLTNVLGDHNVDVIMVGGDIAYDNGLRSCYYCIDLFLRLFDPVNERLGRLVPFVISLGNHDLGFNSYGTAEFDHTKNLYYAYFPQHSTVDSNGNLLNEVPDIADRRPYSYHVIGNTVHTRLDSGYTMYYDGVQANFISEVAEKYHNLVKMATFHVPMYPVCLGSTEDPRTVTEAKEYWGELFQKYNFSSVFENHVHLYKKTHPMLDGEANPGGRGVTYFGDGNWGSSPYICDFDGNSTGIMEAYSTSRHVWLINVTQDVLSHYAVNENNEIFDKVYDFNVADYV